jgi:hypothetical protein
VFLTLPTLFTYQYVLILVELDTTIEAADVCVSVIFLAINVPAGTVTVSVPFTIRDQASEVLLTIGLPVAGKEVIVIVFVADSVTPSVILVGSTINGGEESVWLDKTEFV